MGGKPELSRRQGWRIISPVLLTARNSRVRSVHLSEQCASRPAQGMLATPRLCHCPYRSRVSVGFAAAHSMLGQGQLGTLRWGRRSSSAHLRAACGGRWHLTPQHPVSGQLAQSVSVMAVRTTLGSVLPASGPERHRVTSTAAHCAAVLLLCVAKGPSAGALAPQVML